MLCNLEKVTYPFWALVYYPNQRAGLMCSLSIPLLHPLCEAELPVCSTPIPVWGEQGCAGEGLTHTFSLQLSQKVLASPVQVRGHPCAEETGKRGGRVASPQGYN